MFNMIDGSNKYYGTRRQIEHITVNETYDNRPMRYNKKDLYSDLFYKIIVIASFYRMGFVLLDIILCLNNH